MRYLRRLVEREVRLADRLVGAVTTTRRPFGTSAASRLLDDHHDDDDTVETILSNRKQRRPRLQALQEQLRRDMAEEVNPLLPVSSHGMASNHPTANEKVKVHTTTTSTLRPPSGTTHSQQQHALPPPPIRIHHSPVTYDDWQAILATLPEPPSPNHVLQDSYGRHHNYLRLSLTERCNFRCTYCMPLEGVELQPNDDLLTTSELLSLAEQFAAVGVTKFRLTGGEPTLRKDIVDIVAGLKAINLQSSVGITTNGFLLGQKPRLLDDLVHAGLDSLNMSLDSLTAEKFARITRRPASYLPKILQVLDASQQLDVSVKINIVVMRGQNDDELADFVRLGSDKNVVIRFIEYMPFTKNGWNTSTFISYSEMMEQTASALQWIKLPETDPHDTTKWYRAQSDHDASLSATVGFITSMSHHFCAGCNRLRISADGQIKVCLFDSGSHMVSLRNALRAGLSRQDLYKIVHAAVQSKPFALGGHEDAVDIQRDSLNNRPMTLIGG